MNQQQTTLDDLLAVAGGNRDIKVGFWASDLALLAGMVLIAMFLASLLSGLILKKV